MQRPQLKQAREDLRLTLQLAADLMPGLSRGVVHRWEKGLSAFTMPSRLALSTYCHKLKDYALRMGKDPADFEPWVLCPDVFPAPAPVPAEVG